MQLSTQPGGFSVVDFGMLQAKCGAITKEEAVGYAVELSASLRADEALAILLRDQNGKAVAGAAAGRMWGHYALVEGVAVLPRYRGQGLGAALTINISYLSAQRGLLPVLYSHPSLERVYQRAGFTPLAPLYMTERNKA